MPDASTDSSQSPSAPDSDIDDDQKVKEIEEAHLTESMERLIMEAYKLLQQGQMQQGEQLLLEGSCCAACAFACVFDLSAS